MSPVNLSTDSILGYKQTEKPVKKRKLEPWERFYALPIYCIRLRRLRGIIATTAAAIYTRVKMKYSMLIPLEMLAKAVDIGVRQLQNQLVKLQDWGFIRIFHRADGTKFSRFEWLTPKHEGFGKPQRKPWVTRKPPGGERYAPAAEQAATGTTGAARLLSEISTGAVQGFSEAVENGSQVVENLCSSPDLRRNELRLKSDPILIEKPLEKITDRRRRNLPRATGILTEFPIGAEVGTTQILPEAIATAKRGEEKAPETTQDAAKHNETPETTSKRPEMASRPTEWLNSRLSDAPVGPETAPKLPADHRKWPGFMALMQHIREKANGIRSKRRKTAQDAPEAAGSPPTTSERPETPSRPALWPKMRLSDDSVTIENTPGLVPIRHLAGFSGLLERLGMCRQE